MDKKAPWLNHYGEVRRTLEYPGGNMFSEVEKTARLYPDDIAYSFMGTHVKYKDFIGQIRVCARAFKALGIKRTEKVLVCMPNVPQALCCFYALNLIGAVSVMVHPLSSEGELRFFLENSKAVTVLTLDQFYEKFMRIAQKSAIPRLIITGAGQALKHAARIGYFLKEGRKIKKPAYSESVVSWKAFLEAGNKFTGEYEMQTQANDPAVILYSGGTTGLTKGIVLSNLNLNALALQTREMGHCIERGKAMLTVMPIFHGFGLGVCVHTVLVSACRCILVPRFNIKSYAGLLKKQKPNYIAGVPTLFEALLRSDTLKGADLSCLMGVFSGGDSLSPELKKRFDDFLLKHGSKVKIREGYGTTECVTASCLTPYNMEKEGSIGLPFPDTYYKIVEIGSTNELSCGETGEICISGPSVMLGYLDMPEETAETLRTHDDGSVWLHTGDVGYMDENGFVYFKQRIKRIIISSGYSIYPSQLENVIDAHEAVKMSCVIGVPHPVKIRIPKAFAVLREGFSDSPELRESIMAHCRENIARYAMFKELEIRDTLPTTLVGKVAYKQLEEEEALKNKK